MNRYARLPMSLTLAAAATLSLFFLMSQLVQTPTGTATDESHPPILFLKPPEQQPPQVTDRSKDLQKPEKKVIPTSAASTKLQQDPIPRPSLEPSLRGDGAAVGSFGQGGTISSTALFQPSMKTQPAYPYDARVNGIEGYVVFSYRVSPTGRVIDLEIVEANPRGAFEQAIRDATARWSLPGLSGTQVERIDFRFDD